MSDAEFIEIIELGFIALILLGILVELIAERGRNEQIDYPD